MDKNAVFSYVEFAREELQKLVRQKAFEYGITESGAQNTVNGVINGRVLSKNESEERKQLVNEIRTRCEGKEFAFGFDIVMEEVAYTWFNRFIALRFMEVNNYLPSHTRVFSDDNGKFNPQIIKEAMTLDIYGIDRVKVSDLLQDNKEEELFKYLIILQCNELSKPMPKMFERIANYTELLFPNGLLKKGSIIDRLVNDISEDNWTEQVQIIGWMYQFYISKKKDEVFASKKTITKNTIGAVTQLFTPDWIVRYMAENSIGRIWLESYPNSPLKSEFKYYVDEATQEAEVQEKFEEIRYKDVNPEDIKIIEPCCGSGHILVYCFDLLYKMYLEKGYAQRDIATLILKNNLWGLDVDNRAAQLAYFSVMMKARSVDRTYLRCDENIPQQPRVYEILDSQPILQFDYEELLKEHRFSPDNISIAKYLVSTFKYGKVIGSLLKVKKYNFKDLAEEINEKIKNDSPNIIESEAWDTVLPQLKKLCTLAIVMSRKYDVLITNPPYLTITSLETASKDYLEINYPNSKADLFSMFMETNYIKYNGFLSMINMQSWMFLSSFDDLRVELLKNITIFNLVHLGAHAFESIGGEVVQTVSFIIRNIKLNNFVTTVFDLTEYKDAIKKKLAFLDFQNHIYRKIDKCLEIQGSPLCYRFPDKVLQLFMNCSPLSTQIEVATGLSTSDNNRFLRLWHEVDFSNIERNGDIVGSKCKWFPMAKGGMFRKWYGNNDYLINYGNDGKEIKDYAASLYKSYSRTIKNIKNYCREGMTWSALTTGSLSMRYMNNSIFGSGASCAFPFEKDQLLFTMGFLNSKVIDYFMKELNPTINVNVTELCKIPYIQSSDTEKANISSIVKNCINLCKEDYDCFETSMDFKMHPLVSCQLNSIEDSYSQFQSLQEQRFESLKKNEIEINNYFGTLYEIQEFLDSAIDEKEISITKANLSRETKSLLSYFIGISFNRFSYVSSGVCGIDDNFTNLNGDVIYQNDNIIPILDDEYFQDDAVNKILECISHFYGENNLEGNLKFISDVLGGKGTPRENIRNYMVNSFYSDHLKNYQKRPIYWLFDAGKFNSFKCLIYMHKYSPDLIAKIRTDYILPLLDQYAGRIDYLEKEIPSLNGSANTKARKELDKVRDQLKELSAYELKIHNLADQRISIDLDDGVKHNYELFKDVLAPLK